MLVGLAQREQRGGFPLIAAPQRGQMFLTSPSDASRSGSSPHSVKDASTRTSASPELLRSSDMRASVIPSPPRSAEPHTGYARHRRNINTVSREPSLPRHKTDKPTQSARRKSAAGYPLCSAETNRVHNNVYAVRKNKNAAFGYHTLRRAVELGAVYKSVRVNRACVRHGHTACPLRPSVRTVSGNAVELYADF